MSRRYESGCGETLIKWVIGLIVLIFIASSWWDRWHPTRTTRPLDLITLWYLTIIFVIAPAAILVFALFYVGFLRLIRTRGGQLNSQQPIQPSPEELERQKKEAERLRQLEENKARAEWERYHRFRRMEEVDEMTGLQFEEFAARLFEKVGYLNVARTPINDQGADIICNSPDGRRVVVQAKRWHGKKVGNGAIQEVLAAMLYYAADVAIVITSSRFTESARALAAKDNRITLIDRKKLVEMIEKHWPRIIPGFDWDEYNTRVKGPNNRRERKTGYYRERRLGRF